MELDDLDAAILRTLLGDARLSLRAVARKVASTPTTVGERLRRLEAAGLLIGATLRLDAARLPGETRLVRGRVPGPQRTAFLAAARGVAGLSEAAVTRSGRLFASITVRDLDEEERVLAALEQAGAADLTVETAERVPGPPPLHLFQHAVPVVEACAQCGRATTEPLAEQIDGRRVPFCCPSCRGLYHERYERMKRSATPS